MRLWEGQCYVPVTMYMLSYILTQKVICWLEKATPNKGTPKVIDSNRVKVFHTLCQHRFLWAHGLLNNHGINYSHPCCECIPESCG